MAFKFTTPPFSALTAYPKPKSSLLFTLILSVAIELYESGNMEKYAQNILDADKAGANADKVSADATVEKNTDFSYIYEAAKELAK